MKKLVSIILAAIIVSSMSTFAMSTYDFDNGMRKGINYFNKGLYYEARDEFQWFCDYNWGKMNEGQQKYALDYLDGTKAKIQTLSKTWTNNNATTTENKNSEKVKKFYVGARVCSGMIIYEWYGTVQQISGNRVLVNWDSFYDSNGNRITGLFNIIAVESVSGIALNEPTWYDADEIFLAH